MAVYIDDARVPATVGRITANWSHLTADTLEELHEFAAQVGMKRAWFQDKRIPHYDLVDKRREHAINLGAIPIKWRQTGRMAPSETVKEGE